MSELFEQKRVALNEIMTGGGYRYVRQPDENCEDFISRATTGGTDGDPRKVRRYAKAMARGVKFPPVIVQRRGDEYALMDGHHRCTAATSAGDTAVSAVVFNVVSNFEADIVSTQAFNDSEDGVPWTESVRHINKTLRLVRRAKKEWAEQH